MPLVDLCKTPETMGQDSFIELEMVQQLWNYSIGKNVGAWQEFQQGPNDHLWAKTVREHRRWPELVQRRAGRVTMSARMWAPKWNSCKDLTGQWPCCCTSKGQDGCIELEMAWIIPVVVKLQSPQEFGCPTGIPARAQRTNDHTIAHLVAMMFPVNSRWLESVQQLRSYNVRKN